MRVFTLGLTGLIVGSAGVFAVVVPSRAALGVAFGCMAGIVAVAWIHFAMVARRHDLYWPYIVIGVLSVGPAYAIGLHSAMGGPLAVLLFVGGLFRAEQRGTWRNQRGPVVVGIILSHTLLFVLLLAGVVPDLGNSPVVKPHLSTAAVVVLHFMLQGIYFGAFLAGHAVDRRYEALLRQAEAATRKVALKEAQLADARAELDAVLARESRGIFSGLRIGGYQLGRLLGRGGMGEVYEASSVADGARVALKLVRGDRVAEPRNLKLFVEEAAALGRVQSPHVARVFAVGGIGEELPYLAMELVDGRTLAELLRGRGRLPLGEVADLVRDVARGLADVHDAGVLHLDLKPHNVILAGGVWRLVDFGVARLAGAPPGTGESRDRTWIMGTPSYMAPEQATGGAVDARSDLYSAGTIVYRALTGRPPFVGDHPADIARAAMSGAPPDPRAWTALPDDVAAALRVGLAARPDDRYASAREFGTAFADAFEGRLPDAVRRRAAALAPWTG
jgi:serine/threonine-protein kinase